jgi:hypothetical protein
VKWASSGEESLVDAQDLKADEPLRLANFILENPVEQLRGGYWNVWAKKTRKNINRANRRLRYMYDYDEPVSTADLSFKNARRVCRRTNKHKTRFKGDPAMKFGVEVPRTVKEALVLDKNNGNNKWAEAIQKEMQGLHDHQTFRFLAPGEAAPKEYQFAPLHMVFDVTTDLRHKARLVIGGHVVDSSEHSGYSSVVKMTSIRLLNIIAKAQGLEVLAGDAGNAYLNASTRKKIYTRCGLEFGPEMVGRIAIVEKSLYGLKSSGNRWHAHFANTLYAMGFMPTRYDPDVWYRLREDDSGYDYISTYVDDFMITARDAWSYMAHLQSIYTIKQPANPEIFLGALYTGSPNGDWTISCKHYIKEGLIRIERMVGTLREEKTPSVTMVTIQNKTIHFC